ncbi:hypothetical protein HOF78_03275 [Candidatus Woesearchaeota archaeon]|jgi:hypothetical protein|nr:hypothetical protein [Candidatus Woesearchaeota archaeon]MBT6045115.1 hypothetical protein [Candidatus Woesearchaeota archaeon]
MKKTIIITTLILLIFTSMVHAENEIISELTDVSKDVEAGGAAEYLLNITNHRDSRDVYRITYNELDLYPFSEFARNLVFEPSQLKLDVGESGVMKILLKTVDTSPQDKGYELPLTVSSLTNPEIAEEFILKTYIVSPEDVILIFPEIPDEMVPGEEYKIKIRFKNRGNIELDNYEILITSDLPQFQKNFITNFEPKEEIIETLTLKAGENLKPGDYVVNVKVYDSRSKTKGSYSSAFTITKNENIEELKDKEGRFLKKTYTVTRNNKGNVKTDMEIIANVNFFSRIFSKADPEPIVRKGDYVWQFTLEPGDEFVAEYTTNYRPIFYGLVLIALATLGMMYMLDKSVIIRKRMYKIRRTPEGLSELKILIHLKNGNSKPIKNVTILDVLPNTMAATEEFGTLKPSRVQQGTRGRRFIWEIGELAPQEERILSYKITSKVKLIGETRLPPAVVQFTSSNGKIISEHSASIVLEHGPKAQQDKSL